MNRSYQSLKSLSKDSPSFSIILIPFYKYFTNFSSDKIVIELSNEK